MDKRHIVGQIAETGQKVVQRSTCDWAQKGLHLCDPAKDFQNATGYSSTHSYFLLDYLVESKVIKKKKTKGRVQYKKGESPFFLFSHFPIFLYKSFISPFAGAPAAHEDDAADILVEGEAYPHTEKAVAERNADDVTHADGDRPVEDDGHDDGIDGIARGSQGADGEDVGCASDLEEPVYDKYPHAHRDDVLIVGEGAEQTLA